MTDATETLPRGYIAISRDYAYAPLRVGLSVRHSGGQEIYVQPGDDESAMRNNIEALLEIERDSLRNGCADVALGEYFTGESA